jgi:hypothetical protein
MNLKNILILLVVVAFSSCKKDVKVMPSEGQINPLSTERSDVLPFACDIFTADEILSILGMEQDMEVLDGNRGSSNTNSTSCFYRWNDDDYGMSGVLIQVNRNPLPDEIPDYVTKYMNNKRWEGENSYDDPNTIFKYSDMEGFDFPVIYNRETYRYYFGIKNTFLCSVAFNYPTTGEVLDEWFKPIARKMMAEI